MPRQRLVTALKWLSSIALLAIALSLLDWKELISALLSFSVPMAGVVILLNLAEFPLMGWRWHLLSKKVIDLPFSAQLGRYCAAQFFNSFTPGQLGGDAYRFLTLQGRASTRGQLAALIVQERLIGLAGYLAAFLIGAVMFEITDGISGLSKNARDALRVTELLMFLALVALLMTPLAVQWLQKLGHRMNFSAPKVLMTNLQLATRVFEANQLPTVLVITVIAIAGWCLTIWLVAVDIEVAISVPAILIIATLSELIRVIPITIQGLGLRESTFAAAFALSGHSAETGFIVGSIAYAALTLATFLSGILGLLAVRTMAGGTPGRNG